MMDMSFPPIFSPESKILILGTFPSPMSRLNGFYYGNPRNRFWMLLAGLLNKRVPDTIEEKRDFLITNKIALWDVLESCDIVGAQDHTIANPVPNDLSAVLGVCNISHVYANGSKAGQLYLAYNGKHGQLPFRKLPSTSPANAQFGLNRLMDEWECILEQLKQ
jgi:double-stranded uracil-DNA glycosylase